MSNLVVLARHGETEWSRALKHTSRTDIPLTEAGRVEAAALKAVLATHPFALVLTSPRSRATETAQLAGFADATVDDDLVEWDYGDYEGLTTPEIRPTNPGWTVFTNGAPNGETAEHVAARADRVIARALAAPGDALLFAHAHVFRVIAARWLGLDAAGGRFFHLDSGSLSVLGAEREQRVIRKWNVTPTALL